MQNNIVVKSLTGKERSIQVDKNTTIENVKLKIQDLEGIPTNHQRLIFSGRTLVNLKTLAECGIPNHSSIFLVLTLKGGGGPAFEYSDFEETEERKLEYEYWRRVTPGFFQEGYCNNSDCELNNRLVVCNHGFEKRVGFDIGIIMHKAICPSCKKKIKVEKAGSSSCKIYVEAYDAETGEMKALKKKFPKDRVFSFSEKRRNYTSVKIIVSPLDEALFSRIGCFFKDNCMIL